MFSDKINKCESQIFRNVRILLFKKFFIEHSSFYTLEFRVFDKDFLVGKEA